MRWLSWRLVLASLAVAQTTRSDAFVLDAPSRIPAFWRAPCHERQHKTTALRSSSNDNNDNDNKKSSSNPLDFLFNPYESKIPKEVEKEIYAAEANTEAAKDRTTRIGLYAVIAFVGVAMAFFNGFLSELRGSETPEGVPFDMADSPFAWVVQGNNFSFLWEFFFLNKIGGLICLLGGAGAGLLAEAEFDSRRINSERIYEELVRRREKQQQRAAERPRKKKKKKRQGTKGAKRMGALAEVVVVLDEAKEEEPSPATTPVASEEEVVAPRSPDTAAKETTTTAKAPEEKKKEATAKEEGGGGGGIVDSMKEFYEKADSMAASQALLLNKKLEDAGVLEKITDETGMRVVGKDEAAKIISSSSDANAKEEPATTATTSKAPKKKKKKKKSRKR